MNTGRHSGLFGAAGRAGKLPWRPPNHQQSRQQAFAWQPMHAFACDGACLGLESWLTYRKEHALAVLCCTLTDAWLRSC